MFKFAPGEFVEPSGFIHPNLSSTHKKTPKYGAFLCVAEEVGFEPTKGYKPLPVFKTGAFNRSATLPNLNRRESAYIT